MSDKEWYSVSNAEQVASPALLLWPERAEKNIQRMLEWIGGDVSRLRPHVKTHKMGEVVKMQMAAGITKFKCATIAEAEMTAQAGAPDVLIAYQPVGPNAQRVAALVEKFPQTKFAALVDDEGVLDAVAKVFSGLGKSLTLFLDVDCGMHRTGIEMGDAAVDLCRKVVDTEGVEFGGLHVYDGHIHDPDQEARNAHFEKSYQPLADFVDQIRAAGVEVSLIVAGGSPTFALHASDAEKVTGARWECSPGTTVFWDAGYGTNFPDLGFEPAVVLLMRVISKPGSDFVCLDLGNKAVAPENPLDKRVKLFGPLADGELIGQSEEHLVVKTDKVNDFAVGDVVYGLPWHICPTVALHMEAVLIRDGKASGERWHVKCRDRRLTI
ncbi:MAG: D-TA family PLP-dependent enzyme [Verrucomicrobiales bacterium]|nr:D-TA family PLP-dependent enzyme [Verrucomicrobiales bacterium]